MRPGSVAHSKRTAQLVVFVQLFAATALGCHREPRQADFPIRIIPYEDRYYRWGTAASTDRFPLDAHGVPIVLQDGHPHYDPMRISDDMLVHLDAYRSDNRLQSLTRVEAMAKKLLEIATRSNGALFFPSISISSCTATRKKSCTRRGTRAALKAASFRLFPVSIR